MLQSLHIRNLALVVELDVDFAPGLNVLTGETGTGKSLVIGAFQLLLGERVGPGVIRRGAAQCEIAAAIRFPADFAVVRAAVDALLEEAGAPPCEDGTLLLRRVVSATSGKAYVNSSPVTLQVLRRLGEMLVDLHGPHEHQSLLRPKEQRDMLDAFAGIRDRVAACAQAWRACRVAADAAAAAESATVAAADLEMLRHQLREIESAHLEPEEEARLSARHRIVAHARRLIELAGACARGLSEGDGAAIDGLGRVVRHAEEIAEIDPEHGQDFVNRLAAVVEQVQDVAFDLDAYAETMDVDEAEFSRLEARVEQIHRLKRKYGPTLEDVLERAEQVRTRLATVDGRAVRLDELRAAWRACEQEHCRQCRELSAARRAAAGEQAGGIAAKLHRLGFAQARFEVLVADGTPGAAGSDQVEFCFAPNPGSDPLPLRHIASSGEIARVMLAIKTVLSTADNVPILIFDEIDANVGGRVAVKVAEEMAAVGARHQVLCITHLPQIAAAARWHFQVTKEIGADQTVTRMHRLDPGGREQELIRMLGAEADSPSAMRHARAMLRAQPPAKE